MIGQIQHNNNIESLVNYHFEKIKNGVAEILDYKDVNISKKENLNSSFRAYSKLNDTNKPYLHISLNFHPDDKTKLTDEVYKNITTTYLDNLGYGKQPFFLVKHEDQDHPHVHIITTSVTNESTLISNRNERYISQSISRELELKYDLKIVSSEKREQSNILHLSGKGDLKNYLQSSIKKALDLKPKREEDFFNYLKNEFQIGSYITKDKGGASFYVFEKENGIEIQRYNDFGIKGMTASQIRRDFSFPKLKEQLSKNFNSAPKRYRNLKLSENKISTFIKYFESININDLKRQTVIENIAFFKESNIVYAVDQKGENIYSERDIKLLDKVGEQTIISTKNKLNLFNEIYTEAFYDYKNEVSKDYRTSTFIKNIFVPEKLNHYIQQSELYLYFKSFFDDTTLKEFSDYQKEFIESFKYETIVESEIETINYQKEIIKKFSELNVFNITELYSSLGLHTKNNEKSINSSFKNTINLFEQTLFDLGHIQKLSNEDSFNANIYFDASKHIDFEKLESSFKNSIDEKVTKKVINNEVYLVSKIHPKPKDLLKALNQRGITAYLEKDNANRETLKFSYLNFSTKINIKNMNTFLMETVKNTKQNVNKNVDDIVFIKSIESEYKSKAYNLYKENKVSPDVLKNYNLEKLLSEYDKEVNVKTDLRNFVNEIFRNSSYNYKSEFLEHLGSNYNDYLNSLEESKKELYKEYIISITKPELVSKEELKQKNKFNDIIILLNSYNNKNLAYLLGLKINDKNELTDQYGKYFSSSKILENQKLTIDDSVLKLPLFNYHSHLIKTALKDITLSETPIGSKDIFGLNTVNQIKGLLPNNLYNKLDNYYQQVYIEHFLNKANTKDLNNKELVDYFNSKGIILYQDKNLNEYNFKILGKKVIINNQELPISKSHIKNQLTYFSLYKFNDENRLNETFKFSIALDRENYKEAAFMVLNNPTLLELLSSGEQKIINPIIQKEIVEIKNNSSKSQYQNIQNIDSILDLLSNMFSVTASESKHNEKDKKKHKRKKGRTI